MESSEAAVRRMNRIASHLAAAPHNSCTSSLASMVCSSGSGMQPSSRKDGRLLFARQDGNHLPASYKESREFQGSNAGFVSQGNGRRHNRLLFARQGSHTQAYFMRECLEYQVSSSSEKDGSSCKQLHSIVQDFNVSKMAPVKSNCLNDSSAYSNVEPLFARVVNEEGDASKVWPKTDVKHNELEWLPRMDIGESSACFIVTIELPGVQADGIRVEVNEERLLVSGSRSWECWMGSMKRNDKAFYHRKDLPNGPFKVQWRMPKDVNLDCVSAEFMDGFLRVFLPKIASQ